MRLPRIVIIILAQLATLVIAVPTMFSLADLASLAPCQQIHCPSGYAVLDAETGTCFCPRSNTFRLMKFYDYLTRLLSPSSHLTHHPLRARQANNTTSTSTSSSVTTSFLPPARNAITTALIQQSLSEQPQNMGTISAVRPYFLNGVIQFTVNLVGSAGSNSMLMNASTKIPAATIGDNNELSLIIAPETVNNATEIVTTETATLIAINMYSNQYLTYWVMLNNGTLVSLLSDCKVHDINLITPNTDFLSIMPSPYTSRERNTRSASATASPSWRMADEIYRRASPGSSGITKRGLAGVNNYNSKMTQESCRNMKCTLDGQSPMWNMFTANCYCDISPAYWTLNPSGETGAVTG